MNKAGAAQAWDFDLTIPIDGSKHDEAFSIAVDNIRTAEDAKHVWAMLSAKIAGSDMPDEAKAALKQAMGCLN